MLLHFCTRNRGNRCFNIVRPLALEFGLLCMVRQPSTDTHVIWVAQHKVTRPQTILKFWPPSSLDYRTRHGSQSLRILWLLNLRIRDNIKETLLHFLSLSLRPLNPSLRTPGPFFFCSRKSCCIPQCNKRVQIDTTFLKLSFIGHVTHSWWRKLDPLQWHSKYI
jgi:hypothetical protein